jgi:uncharacterized protein (TIGR04255 family)
VGAHPSFKSPTILEALCEIHFRLSAEHPWTATKPGDFFQRVLADYPTMEPIVEQAVQLTIGPDKMPRQELLPPRLKLKFTHRDPAYPTLLQVSDSTFALNTLSPYPGWETMKAKLLIAWATFRAQAQPVEITRIGLRYINRIQRLSKSEQPGYWLRETRLIPAALLKSGEGFSFRLELRLDDHNRLFTTIAHATGLDTGPFGALFFDVDRVVERGTSTEDSALDSAIETLHEDVWNVFVEAKSGNYDRLLNGETFDVVGGAG